MTKLDARRAVQGLLGGLLLAYASKAAFWIASVKDLAHTPLSDPFFPRPLASVAWLAAALLLPTLALCVALLRHQFGLTRGALLASACGSTVLMLHQASFNDASFLTAWWSSLYGLWLVRAIQRGAHGAFPARLAIRLAASIVALMFLGGAIGKLTSGYWDGSIFHALNFVGSDYWTFRLARSLLSAQQLRDAATLYSRIVVCVEWTLVGLAFVPTRFALRGAMVVLLSMAALNNHLLLSVVGPLLGVCAAALVCTRSNVAVSRALASIQHRLVTDESAYAKKATT